MTLPVLILLVAAMQPDEMIAPGESLAGVLMNESLRSAAPPSGLIVDQEAFEALWDRWRPGQETPQIDFARQFVVVETIDGPNRMFLQLSRREGGDVGKNAGGTRIGGPGFGYIIASFARDGIKSINRRPLPGKGSEPARPVDDGGKERGRTGARESVRVAVQGTLETGVVAIGGETTGTVVRANGMKFELALDEPILRAQAERLGGRSVLVTGELAIRQGVETGARLVIEVGWIAPAEDAGREDPRATSEDVGPPSDELPANEVPNPIEPPSE